LQRQQRQQRSLEQQLVLSCVMQPGMSSFAANLKPRSDGGAAP
jgi:hypothetical protein